MAKSKIIKDLANGVVDTQTALKRTKVLLQDLGDKDLLNWVSYEIGGYPDDSDVPEYRVVSGQLYGSYFKGSMVSQIFECAITTRKNARGIAAFCYMA